jgi:uncharacterized protein
MNAIYQPWPWYVCGPLIGLSVPLLLLLGNKRLGVSSSLRHMCAACLPNTEIRLFRYNWRTEAWSLIFVVGLLFGGYIGGNLLHNGEPVQLAESTKEFLQANGIDHTQSRLMPSEIFNWNTLFSLKGFIIVILGGLMVGFGTRYAQGCTSGHGIFGLATFQWPSLVAIICFFAGGIIVNKFLLPLILSL